MRYFKSVSHYPAYTHTSYNLEHNREHTRLHLSLHLKWAWADRGFVIGLRPELDITHHTERTQAMLTEMRFARVMFYCAKCGRREWGAEGMRHPEGWEWIRMLDFCGACSRRYSYHDLLSH